MKKTSAIFIMLFLVQGTALADQCGSTLMPLSVSVNNQTNTTILISELEDTHGTFVYQNLESILPNTTQQIFTIQQSSVDHVAGDEAYIKFKDVNGNDYGWVEIGNSHDDSFYYDASDNITVTNVSYSGNSCNDNSPANSATINITGSD